MSCNRIIAIVLVCLFLFTNKAESKLWNHDFSSLNQSELLNNLIRYCDDTLAKLPPLSADKEFTRLLKLAENKDLPTLTAVIYIIRARYQAHQNPDDSTFIYRTLKTGLNIAVKNNLNIITAYGQFQLGNAYYMRNRLIEGIEELLKANEILKNIGYEKMPEAANYLLVLGSMYCDYHEYIKALKYIVPALNLAPSNTVERYNLLGTIGLAFYHLKKADSSIYYSSQALAVARHLGDTVLMGSMSGNIGIAYLRKKNYQLALRYLHTDYQTSLRYGQTLNAARAKLIIAKVYFENNQPEDALHTLDTVQQMITPLKGTVNIFWELYSLLARIYSHKKDYYKAVIYQDSFIKYNEAYHEMVAPTIVRGLELKISSEIYETHIRLLDSEKKRQILLRNALIVATLLTIIIIIQMFYRFRLKQKAEQKILALNLENAEKKLATYIQSLREKNQLLEQFEDELKQIRAMREPTASHTETTAEEDVLAKIHNASLITDEGWNEFTGLVNSVHKNFFIRLRQIYPNLTPAETRLLTLVKLQFTTKEMATMLGISQDSVKKGRQRARKKINIADTEDLYEVLKSI